MGSSTMQLFIVFHDCFIAGSTGVKETIPNGISFRETHSL